MIKSSRSISVTLLTTYNDVQRVISAIANVAKSIVLATYKDNTKRRNYNSSNFPKMSKTRFLYTYIAYKNNLLSRPRIVV